MGELRLVISQERSERLQEIALIRDELDNRRRTEVEKLQKELTDILNDRSRLSQDDVLKLMTGKQCYIVENFRPVFQPLHMGKFSNHCG